MNTKFTLHLESCLLLGLCRPAASYYEQCPLSWKGR